MKNLFLLLFIGLFYTNIAKAQFQSWFEPSLVTRNGVTYIQKVGFYAFGGSKIISGGGGSVPDVPTLITPANSSYDASLLPILDWSNVATATSYDLLVDNNSDFSSPIVTTSPTSSIYTVVEAFDCEAHYWKVRANNSYGSSAYSSAFTFDTRTIIPTLTQPLNGTTGLNSFGEIEFYWISTGAINYTFQIASDVEFVSLLIEERIENEEYFLTAGSIEPLNTYYWRVGSQNSNNCTIWSPAFSFITSF